MSQTAWASAALEPAAEAAYFRAFVMGATILNHRRVAFQNTRFTVFADHIAAGALEVLDFLVVAPHCYRADGLTGVAVIPIRQDLVLLLDRYRHPVSGRVWELPRGFIDAGEEPADAALRELAEETGLACPPKKLIHLGSFMPDPGILSAHVALYAAAGCQPGAGRLHDEIGIEGSHWYARDEVKRLLRTGAIQDGASCVALYRYFAALEDGGTE